MAINKALFSLSILHTSIITHLVCSKWSNIRNIIKHGLVLLYCLFRKIVNSSFICICHLPFTAVNYLLFFGRRVVPYWLTDTFTDWHHYVVCFTSTGLSGILPISLIKKNNQFVINITWDLYKRLTNLSIVLAHFWNSLANSRKCCVRNSTSTCMMICDKLFICIYIYVEKNKSTPPEFPG